MRIDHNKIQLTFFRDGLAAIEGMIDDGEVTGFMLRRALREMDAAESRPGDVAGFRDMLDRRGFMPSLRTGNKPEAGDVRTYKVQQGKSGLFIRFPVDHMDVAKGGSVRVRFTVGGGTAEQGDK